MTYKISNFHNLFPLVFSPAKQNFLREEKTVPYLTLNDFSKAIKRILELPFSDVPRQTSDKYPVLFLSGHFSLYII